MNCPNCGNEINENQKFCSKCGKQLNEDYSSLENNENIVAEIMPKAIISLVIVGLLGVFVWTGNNTSVNNSTPKTVAEDTETNENDLNSEDTEVAEEEHKYVAPKPKCLYETSDGVCFTTKTFSPTTVNYYDCTGGHSTFGVEEYPSQAFYDIGVRNCKAHYDYWVGAMKMCNDWGYKLPDEYELSSLAKDMYGTIISNELDVHTYLPDGHTINMIPIEKLNIQYKKYWNIYLEDSEKDSAFAFGRYLNQKDTKRVSISRDNWPRYDAVCVYNPNGVAKKSYAEYERQKIEEEKKKQQELLKEQEEQKNREIKYAEDNLF